MPSGRSPWSIWREAAKRTGEPMPRTWSGRCSTRWSLCSITESIADCGLRIRDCGIEGHVMKRSYCDGVERRDFVRLGLAGLFGASLSLPRLLKAEAAAGQAAKDRGVSVIYVFLKGGMSTIDTLDMKPHAPAEFRGEFDPGPTSVPGVQICSLLPKLAGQLDKAALLRGFWHKNSDHGPADHYMLTGYFPQAGFNPSLNPNNVRPSLGSIISKKLGPQGPAKSAAAVPPYVCLPQTHNSSGAAYLGATCAPLSVEADPSAPDFSVPDMMPPLSLPADRLSARR